MTIPLRDLLLGGPGHDGYAYNADVYCVSCGQDIIRECYAAHPPESLDETSNSEEWPVPIFFGESDCAEHCGHCGEYLYGPQEEDAEEEDAEEESDEFHEPEEGDYTTEDHVHFYSYGKLVVTVPEGDDWQPHVRAAMDADKFWPNVWWISDHGNAHILTMND